MRHFAVIAAAVLTASLAFSQSTRPAGRTQHDDAAAILKFDRSNLRYAYDQSGRHSAKWDAAAGVFLDRMAARWTDARFDVIYSTGQDTENETLLKLAEPLLQSKCDDPLVLYCLAVVRKDNGNPDIYRSLMERAVPGLLSGNYPFVRRYWAAAQWADLQAPNTPERCAANETRDKQLLKYLLEPTGDPAERRVKVTTVEEVAWKNADAAERHKLVERLGNEPAADKWMTAMLRGEDEILTAWSARGTGFANTVTPQGWQGYREHIAKARNAFIEADHLEPTLPDAAAKMIVVAMAENDVRQDDPRAWFDRAKAAQIDYMPAWRNYGYALQPKWSGSNHEMYLLGQKAVQTGRFDTEVPLFLLEMLNDIVANRDGDYEILKTPDVWKNVASAFDGYLAGHVERINESWLRTRRAAYAYHCGEYAEAKKMLAMLGDQAWRDVFTGLGTDIDTVKAECAAMTSDQSAAVKAALIRERLADHAGAAKAYAAIEAKLPANHPALAFVQFRKQLEDTSARFASGETVTLPMHSAADWATWRGDPEGWSFNADGMHYSGPLSTGSRIIQPATLPARCRITMEWKWTTPKPHHAPRLDLILQDLGKDGFLSVEFFPRDNVMGVGTDDWSLDTRKAPADPVDLSPNVWHTLIVEHTDEVATVTSDGTILIDHLTNHWLKVGKPMLGLHGFTSSVGGTLDIRKLTVESLR